MSGGRRRAAGLGLGLLLMAGVVLLLHRSSEGAPGVLGLSRTLGLETNAYFYSEVTTVGAFLGEDGRYARLPEAP